MSHQQDGLTLWQVGAIVNRCLLQKEALAVGVVVVRSGPEMTACPRGCGFSGHTLCFGRRSHHSVLSALWASWLSFQFMLAWMLSFCLGNVDLSPPLCTSSCSLQLAPRCNWMLLGKLLQTHSQEGRFVIFLYREGSGGTREHRHVV